MEGCSTLVGHHGMPNEVCTRDCEMISNHDWEIIATMVTLCTNWCTAL